MEEGMAVEKALVKYPVTKASFKARAFITSYPHYQRATFETLCQVFGFIDTDPDDIDTLAEIMTIWDGRLAALYNTEDE